MIRSWANEEAEATFCGSRHRTIGPEIAKAARRRLAQLNAAAEVEDMRSPPGNRLHRLDDGRWSVSVNDHFRITFSWNSAGPEDVWFGDYH